MTAVLLAAVLVLTALTLANLLLVFGVIRRLRSHEERLSGLAEPTSATTLAVGERVADFDATTTTGRMLSRSTLDGYTLVGILSTTCDACHERLPTFVSTARRHPATIAVVVRDGGDVGGITGHLDGVDGLDIVVEDPDGPMAKAFGVRGFPTFLLIDAEGTVRSQGFDLPLPVEVE